MLDLSRLRESSLTREPFDHVIVPGFIPADRLTAISLDFPRIEKPGSFPTTELSFGPAFAELLDQLRGPELTAAISRKFDTDLSERPTMLTVRGCARAKDGRIHTDTKTKIITVLIYMNESWHDAGGRLRLLRSERSLDDYFAEVVPAAATMVAFRCTDNAYHGHTRYVGERRVLQLNWVTDDSVVQREQARHRLSAKLKKWLPAR